MNIGIDYRLATQHVGGMGVYLRNLVTQLQKGEKNNYILLDNNQKNDLNSPLLTRLLRVFLEQCWVQIGLVKMIFDKKIDVLFSPNPPVPILSPVPIILTIPDLAFYFDEQIGSLAKIYLYITYFVAARRARIITTFSAASKDDIKKILKVDQSKIVVIPLAANNVFRQAKVKTKTKFIKSLGVTRHYILSTPGSFVRRKNVQGLLQAYKLLPAEIRKQLQLVICASTNSHYFPEVKQYAEDLGLGDDVIFTGYVEPESDELIELYWGALIFAFPSKYEGFGLPPLEAMKCGIPVIVGNNSSLPEVVGNAGYFVNNSKELAQAITRLYKNPKLRSKLATAGPIKARDYSWEKTARMFEGALTTFSQSVQVSRV